MNESQPAAVEPAHTIDEVVDRLDAIIKWAREQNSRLGFFAALYRKVTIRVRYGIHAKEFRDGERMERLDVIFANRYLEAFARHRNGLEPSASWQFTFESSGMWQPLILQHLLLGINAHINLDLGVAAAETIAGGDIEDLRPDFYQINKLLASLLSVVQDDLNILSPVLKLLDYCGGRTDEAVMNFSILKARNEAWKFAESLAGTSDGVDGLINAKDEQIAKLAKQIRNPGWFLTPASFFIRMFETSDVASIINRLY
jgi:hypothetical protein